MSTRSIAKTDRLRKLELAVAVFLTILLIGFIGLAVRYPARARLFPLLVAIPSLLCMLLIISAFFSERAKKFVRSFNTVLFESDTDLLEEDETEVERGQIQRSLGWVIGALVGFYLFGFVLMTFIFVYAYMSYEGGHTRRRSGVLALLTTVAMFALFVVVFGVRLRGGVVFRALFELPAL